MTQTPEQEIREYAIEQLRKEFDDAQSAIDCFPILERLRRWDAPEFDEWVQDMKDSYPDSYAITQWEKGLNEVDYSESPDALGETYRLTHVRQTIEKL